MKISKIKENQLFRYNGNIYKFININENWRKLCDKDGNAIPPKIIPIELLNPITEVEL